MMKFDLVRNSDQVVASDIRPGKRRSSWRCKCRFQRHGNNPMMDNRFEKLGELINTHGE